MLPILQNPSFVQTHFRRWYCVEHPLLVLSTFWVWPIDSRSISRLNGMTSSNGDMTGGSI